MLCLGDVKTSLTNKATKSKLLQGINHGCFTSMAICQQFKIKMTEKIDIPCVSSDGVGASYFTVREIELSGDQSRSLSEQIPAENFRLRKSGIGYASGFHVAGDPTLLIILAGKIRISIRSGDHKDFTVGDMFIAEDYLAKGVTYSEQIHGHKAELLDNAPLCALHLKLEKRY